MNRQLHFFIFLIWSGYKFRNDTQSYGRAERKRLCPVCQGFEAVETDSSGVE